MGAYLVRLTSLEGALGFYTALGYRPVSTKAPTTLAKLI